MSKRAKNRQRDLERQQKAAAENRLKEDLKSDTGGEGGPHADDAKEIVIEKQPPNRGILGWRSFADYLLRDATDLDGMGINGGTKKNKTTTEEENQQKEKKKVKSKQQPGNVNPWKNLNRTKARRGPNEKMPSDLRYPYSTIDDTQDFLKFSIFQYRRSYEDQQRYRDRNDFISSGAGSLANEQNNLRDTRDLLGNIILPIPAQLADANSTAWGESKMNAFEGDLYSAAGKIIEGNSAREEFGTALGKLSNNKNMVSNWFTKQAVNSLIGGNLTLDQIMARNQGEILNPNMELLFSGPTLRNFSFNFKLTPRYQKEAQIIRTIIKAFKRNMAPKGSGGVVLRTPNIFQLEYLGKARDYLNRMKICALKNVSVNYTGDGTFATYQDGAPISSMLTLQFTELTPIYNEDYEGYDNNEDGVGF